VNALLLASLASVPEVHQTILADGTELAFARTPGVDRASMRFVVRAGGAADPRGQAGLAHLLEHSIFHGSYETSEKSLFERMRAKGAIINAFTTTAYTYYTLDAPRAEFAELAASYLEVITNPALTMVDLEREVGITGTEKAMFFRITAFWVAQQFLFPGLSRGASLIGSDESRHGITRGDLMAFYATWYIPTNATILVAGDFEQDSISSLVESSVRYPPVDEAAPTASWEPNVPIDETMPSALQATFFGYLVEDTSRGTCRDLAQLVDVRATLASLRRPSTMADVRAHCARFFDRDFILVYATSNSYEGGGLSEALRKLFQDVRDHPLTPSEKSVIRGRFSTRQRLLAADPTALLDALVEEAALSRKLGQLSDFRTVLGEPTLDAREIQAVAQKNFKSEHAVSLTLTPFKR
jgi:hypothetical protein